jgi:hypothetical protein
MREHDSTPDAELEGAALDARSEVRTDTDDGSTPSAVSDRVTDQPPDDTTERPPPSPPDPTTWVNV